MRSRTTGGFTLVELMVTVAVAAVLAAIAFPSFENSIRSNRVATASNEVLGTIALARSEALRSPGGALLCASTDGATCNGSSWNDGWMVWLDANGDGTVAGPNDRVVRHVQALNALDITTTGAGANLIRFDNRGRTIGAARTITLRPQTCPSGDPLVRTISLTTAGQARVERSNCA